MELLTFFKELKVKLYNNILSEFISPIIKVIMITDISPLDQNCS